MQPSCYARMSVARILSPSRSPRQSRTILATTRVDIWRPAGREQADLLRTDRPEEGGSGILLNILTLILVE